MAKRILKYGAIAAAVVAVLVVGFGLWAYSRITGSLPTLDGHIRAAGLTAEVLVERDELGIPTIRARNRNDLAFATGFVHAQDRFFQMDLLRRNSAGELGEIVGAAALDHDRNVRVHRFRDAARRVLEQGNANDRKLLEAYAQGVNAGLASLRAKPFEYWLLNVTPAPWQPEDSALVMYSMYLDLQDSQYRHENRRGLIHDLLGEQMLAFLCPRGTQWDAPVDGEPFAMPATPGPEVFDTRNTKQVARQLLAPPGQVGEAEFHAGSNNWAVAGTHSADGRAIVADDMHLSIRVPHVWYRASLVWPAGDGKPASAQSAAAQEEAATQRVTGVTLPGTPAVIVGSNGRVAWGFTNSEGDWADIIIVEVDPSDKESYLTPDGPRKFEHHTEIIKVKGQPDQKLDVVSTIWGPIVDRDHRDRPRALRWVAYDTEGVNMNLIAMESAATLEDALRLANLSGSPAQNFMVADDRGRIAWTILGRIPRRVGFDGYLPTSWADGKHRWDGYLTPEQYPRIVDPSGGKLWTANARVVSGQMLEIVGDGGYDLGARARQIRDGLLATNKATEADMLRIQLDDRAVFLAPWRELLLKTLTPEAIDKHPQRAALRAAVENWGDRAGVDSVGYRGVRAFRRVLLSQISDVLIAPCKQFDPKFSIAGMDRTEGPLWQLVSERPEHMLDPRYPTWDALLLSAVDNVIEDAQKSGGSLNNYAWGRYNTTRIQHPLSQAVPALAGWLDMPARALSGDSENMPRIQGPDKGASQRMAVSPGHEADGYMHMPCGQSGHPLSPHYRDAHQAWEEGRPTPFLPGPVVHRLVLEPAA